MAQIVAVGSGEASDSLNAAEELVFSSNAVTAKHQLRRSTPLQ
jgi:hypothetical protein